jgi:outer membrane biosynthesis protein TonB
VYELASHDEQTLEEQLSNAREKLDALDRDLRGFDDALEALSEERHQYGLLQQVCSGLDELRELGAAGLFWGEGAVDGGAEEHLRLVQARVDAFDRRIAEVDDRRDAVLQEIARAQDAADFIEDDLLEAQRQEEERKLEWIVEREVDEFPIRPSVMPWARGGEEDRRFRKALLAALLLSLFFGVIFPLIDIPPPEAWQANQVPERFTRLIREEKPLPPPPVQQEKLPQESEPKLAEESMEAEKPKVAPKQEAPSKGILAFREKFSDLAEAKPSARLGAEARIRKAGEAASGAPQRALVTTQAAGSSGGIDIGSLSRNVGGGGDGQIERVEVARATSSIGAGGGSDRPLSDGPGLSRTDEEIQIVFDRHKAALYRVYNRELRRDPTLQGQVVLRMTIEPDGSVSLCEVQSSDMRAPKLSAQVVSRVKTFDFGAKDGIKAITILYPIDFLPAT